MKSDALKRHALTAAVSFCLVCATAHATTAPPNESAHLMQVDAADLAATTERRAEAMQHFAAGRPLLVRIGEGDRAAVTRAFGAAPAIGDAIFMRGSEGALTILRQPEGSTGWTPRWTAATQRAFGAFERQAAAIVGTRAIAGAANGDELPAGLPMLRVHEGTLASGSDEMTGTWTVTVYRSSTVNEDDKEIHVEAWPVIRPAGAGIDNGHAEGRNLSAAYLPWRYVVRHAVTTDDTAPALVSFLPKSDQRTEFEKTETNRSKVTFGGSLGNAVSEDGNPDAGLAAKLPFNLSASFEREVGEELKFRFHDYSLDASTNAQGSHVVWSALIDPSLKHVLVERPRVDGVDLTEKKMTPMMRSASLATSSTWELPGDYEGMARVTVSGGYDLNEKKWWWDATEWKHAETQRETSHQASIDIDLGHPFLTRETTVLLRSADAAGACLAQREGEVVMARCDQADRGQMWGLDSEGRYMNRADGRCLEANVDSKRLGMARCSLDNTQVWEWRADRIHSGYGDKRHRLHVDGNGARFFVESAQFDDVPVNPHHPALKPWAGYPKAPIEGELVPAPFGRQAGHVPRQWSDDFGAVGTTQRWTPVILRAGI
ncbi:RICIN domain-containing protein [Bacillus sp. NP157]|nr:RICIN domain-containing protein [Bacillus sp. NP157]